MSIRSNLGTGPIAVLTTTTVLHETDPNIERIAVSALSVHNTTGSAITVSFFISDTLTGGVRVEQLTLRGNGSLDANALIGQGYESQNILAIASAAGVNAALTRVEYTDGD